MKTTVSLGLAGLLCAGCAGPGFFGDKPRAQVIERAGIDLVTEPAGYRTVLFKQPGTRERVCRTPGPDFAMTASEGVSIELPAPRGADGVGGEIARGDLALGGRNPEVLVARELMYRACELSLNIDADPATTRAIYERFLKAVENVARYQTGAGAAALAAQAPATAVRGANDDDDRDDDSDDDDSDDDKDDDDK